MAINFQILKKVQQFTDELVMNYLTSHENPNPGEAWDQLHETILQADPFFENRINRSMNYTSKGVFNMIKKYRGVAVAATVTLAVAISLSFAPVRAMASDLLSIFRVNNFQTVTISPNDLTQIQKHY